MDRWSTTTKGCSVENDPRVTVSVVVPQGVMFLPSLFTNLEETMGVMFSGDI